MGISFTPTRLSDLVVDVSSTMSGSSARGDLFVRTATNWDRLALGAVGKIITSNGTDIVWGDLEVATGVDFNIGTPPFSFNESGGVLTLTTPDTNYIDFDNNSGNIVVNTGISLLGGMITNDVILQPFSGTVTTVTIESNTGHGFTFLFTGSTASGGNYNGGDLVFKPGIKAGSGTDGRFVIRQPGGVAGTDELHVYHDGTNVYIKNMNDSSGVGKLFFISSSGSGNLPISAGMIVGGSSYFSQGMSISGVGGTLSSTAYIGWGSASNQSIEISPDTILIRGGAGILSFCKTSSSVGGTYRSVPLTPTQITADQNNYNPGVALNYRLSTDAARKITGLAISQIDGQVCEFWNVGTSPIILTHEDTNSTAANRFLINDGGVEAILPGNKASLRYDSTSSRWRVQKHNTFAQAAAILGA